MQRRGSSFRLKGIKVVVKPNGRRYLYRRVGAALVPLPDLPENHPDFIAAYHEAANAPQPSRSRAKAGTLRALAEAYLASHTFKSLAPSTREARRRIIDHLCDRGGHVIALHIQPRHIRADLAKFSPHAANNTLKVWRALMAYGVETGALDENPAIAVRKVRAASEGFHTWSEAEIEQFEAHHPSGTKARLMLALLLYTGQRISDVAPMGWQHVRGDALTVRQQKTATPLVIPIAPELAAELRQVPRDRLAFLVTGQGQPHATPKALANWFRKVCDQAGLNRWSAHGGRKAAARRLAEAGCSVHEIAAITGHKSLAEVARYTAAADQERLARAAQARTERKQNLGNSLRPVSKNGEKPN